LLDEKGGLAWNFISAFILLVKTAHKVHRSKLGREISQKIFFSFFQFIYVLYCLDKPWETSLLLAENYPKSSLISLL